MFRTNLTSWSEPKAEVAMSPLKRGIVGTQGGSF